MEYSYYKKNKYGHGEITGPQENPILGKYNNGYNIMGSSNIPTYNNIIDVSNNQDIIIKSDICESIECNELQNEHIVKIDIMSNLSNGTELERYNITKLLLNRVMYNVEYYTQTINDINNKFM